jgi:hypothetical protein
MNDQGTYGQTILHRLLQLWASTIRGIGKRPLKPSEINAFLQDEVGRNPANGLIAWTMDLAERAIDLEKPDMYGASSIQYAVKLHNVVVLQDMLSRASVTGSAGAVLASDNYGNTALHLAAGGGAWHAGLSKSMLFSQAETIAHHTVHNNPTWCALLMRNKHKFAQYIERSLSCDRRAVSLRHGRVAQVCWLRQRLSTAVLCSCRAERTWYVREDFLDHQLTHLQVSCSDD